jgi:SM-20-related protein
MSLSATHEPEGAAAGPAMIDYAAFDAAELQRDPFDHLIVPNFLTPTAVAAVNRDYPEITGPANFKLAEIEYGPAFADFVEALSGPELTRKMAAKFKVDLPSNSTSITVRKFCEQTDGNIHVDHRTKIISMLVYFNETWDGEGGRFRILRSADDIEDYAAEIVPLAGTMVAFRRTDKSYHGHKRHVGERRMVQCAWVSEGTLARQEKRLNRLTKPVRRLLNMS